MNNYWDRGLTGITLDPDFGTPGNNWVYVNYTYNRNPRDNPPVVPKWDSGEGSYDGCTQPAAMPARTAPARQSRPQMTHVRYTCHITHSSGHPRETADTRL